MAFDFREFKGPGELAPCVYSDEDKEGLLEDTFAEMFKVRQHAL